MQPKVLGTHGEQIAAKYLEEKGYKLLDANFTVRGGEIDLIAKHNNVLVFVEVKTRKSFSFGKGEESVNSLKRRTLQRTIKKYLYKHNLEQCDYRLDLIDIELDGNNGVKKINHFQDLDI